MDNCDINPTRIDVKWLPCTSYTCEELRVTNMFIHNQSMNKNQAFSFKINAIVNDKKIRSIYKLENS